MLYWWLRNPVLLFRDGSVNSLLQTLVCLRSGVMKHCKTHYNMYLQRHPAKTLHIHKVFFMSFKSGPPLNGCCFQYENPQTPVTLAGNCSRFCLKSGGGMQSWPEQPHQWTLWIVIGSIVHIALRVSVQVWFPLELSWGQPPSARPTVTVLRSQRSGLDGSASCWSSSSLAKCTAPVAGHKSQQNDWANPADSSCYRFHKKEHEKEVGLKERVSSEERKSAPRFGFQIRTVPAPASAGDGSKCSVLMRLGAVTGWRNLTCEIMWDTSWGNVLTACSLLSQEKGQILWTIWWMLIIWSILIPLFAMFYAFCGTVPGSMYIPESLKRDAHLWPTSMLYEPWASLDS